MLVQIKDTAKEPDSCLWLPPQRNYPVGDFVGRLHGANGEIVYVMFQTTVNRRGHPPKADALVEVMHQLGVLVPVAEGTVSFVLCFVVPYTVEGTYRMPYVPDEDEPGRPTVQPAFQVNPQPWVWGKGQQHNKHGDNADEALANVQQTVLVVSKQRFTTLTEIIPAGN